MLYVVFVVFFLQNLCFFVSERRLTFRLRTLTFQSILCQEMAWFDLKENSPSTLTSRLAIDAAQIPGVRYALGTTNHLSMNLCELSYDV